MSVPTFPQSETILTKDEAISLLLTSLGMTLSALSNIVNSESEKLKYLLGTLYDPPAAASPTVEDLMAAIASVQDTLTHLSTSNQLVKNNLKQLLATPLVSGPPGATGPMSHTFVFDESKLEILATLNDSFYPKMMVPNKTTASGQLLHMPHNGIVYFTPPLASTTPQGLNLYSTLTIDGTVNITNSPNLKQLVFPVKKGDTLQLTLQQTSTSNYNINRTIYYEDGSFQNIPINQVYFLPHAPYHTD